jgi:hypothetical protein
LLVEIRISYGFLIIFYVFSATKIREQEGRTGSAQKRGEEA